MRTFMVVLQKTTCIEEVRLVDADNLGAALKAIECGDGKLQAEKPLPGTLTIIDARMVKA